MPVRILVSLSALLIVVLFGAATVLISATRGPERVIEIGRCGGTPCWNGIVPGKTSPTDAAAIIAADTRLTAQQIASFSSDDGQHIASLLLNRPSLQLGEILVLYGSPQCVDIYRQAGTMTLHYALLHALTRFQNDQISSDSPILSLVLGTLPGAENVSVSCKAPRVAEIDRVAARRQWQGFASLQKYLASPV